MICPLSLSHLFALGAFQLYFLLLFFDARLACLPLLVFVLLCLAAPLFPRFGFYLPIVSHGDRARREVALTFDDGPDPSITPLVLDLLDRHSVSATFFITGDNAEKNPEIVREILARGHTLGNHSLHHSPFLMLKGSRTLRHEIRDAQRIFRELGAVPLAFRPPVGITSPRLWRPLLESGMFCVNFSCRAFDRGNRSIVGLAAKIFRRVRPGDIVMLHDIAPKKSDAASLLKEFETVLEGIRKKGLAIVPLERLIGKEVMQRDASSAGPVPAEAFYDGLASSYDHEQLCSNVSISRRTEYGLFSARLEDLFHGADRVLEIGAGTGLFTLTIAEHCREVIAVDISSKMLNILDDKAKAKKVTNIVTRFDDIETMELDGRFSIVCAFSALEYLKDLPALLRRLAPHMEAGDALYFITARRSLFRLFTQIGNALRQGLWLKAHSRREMQAMLREAGFEPIELKAHLLKCGISGGMLLEVLARRAA